MVHCETSTGVFHPVEAVGKLVKEHAPGASFFVDAMSSFGAVPLNSWFGQHWFHGELSKQMHRRCPRLLLCAWQNWIPNAMQRMGSKSLSRHCGSVRRSGEKWSISFHSSHPCNAGISGKHCQCLKLKVESLEGQTGWQFYISIITLWLLLFLLLIIIIMFVLDVICDVVVD